MLRYPVLAPYPPNAYIPYTNRDPSLYTSQLIQQRDIHPYPYTRPNQSRNPNPVNLCYIPVCRRIHHIPENCKCYNNDRACNICNIRDYNNKKDDIEIKDDSNESVEQFKEEYKCNINKKIAKDIKELQFINKSS